MIYTYQQCIGVLKSEGRFHPIIFFNGLFENGKSGRENAFP